MPLQPSKLITDHAITLQVDMCRGPKGELSFQCILLNMLTMILFIQAVQCLDIASNLCANSPTHDVTLWLFFSV